MSETMTIKELSQAAGCSVNTVRKVIKDSFPDLTKNGKVTNLSKEQAFDVMTKLPKRNYVDLTKSSKVDRELIASIVAETIKQLIPYLQLPANQEPPRIQIAEINPRDEVRRLVNLHQEKTQIAHGMIWNKLYDEAYYRLHKNFKTLAANRDIGTLDMIEQDGYMPQFLEMARKVLVA
jgi:hypothetical protein